jgi:putative DNA primase/helicase
MTNQSYVQAAIDGALADFHGSAGPGNINDPLFRLAARLFELAAAAPDVLSADDAAQRAADAAAMLGHDAVSVKGTIRSAQKSTAGKAAVIPAPAYTNGNGAHHGGYADLAAYAAAHGVPAEVFERAGWSNAVLYEFEYLDKDGDTRTGHEDEPKHLNGIPRRALRFTTDTAPRYRLIDQDKPKPKYWHAAGSHQGAGKVWYRLGEALALAAQVGYLVLCNGEASTVVAQHYGVPALCEAGGGEKATPDHLLLMLRAIWQGRIIVALDCDGAGQKGAATKRAQLHGAGWADARAIDLALGAGEDLADFCRLHDAESVKRLPLCADLPLAAAATPGAAQAVQRTQSQAIIDLLATFGYTFRMNACTGQIEVNGEAMNDVTAAEIRVRLRDEGWRKFPAVEDAITTHAAANAYHPVKDYLNGLTWDGRSHIAALAAAFKSKDPPVVYSDGSSCALFSVYLHRWLVGAVAKALDGEQNAMLVLLGPQNIGKSHFSRWLCPPCLVKEHYIESPIDLGDKDSRIRLMTKLIWEVSELDATTRKSDVAALKHFITQQQVIVRRSYARYDTQGPAMASMIGTVNSDGFLADETGNRRFYIVAISALDWAYQAIPIDQVWAEAVARYRRGEPWQLTAEERAHQTIQNRGYYQETPLHDYFKRHIAVTRDPSHRMTSADIIDILRAKDVPIGLTDHQIAIQLGRVAASLGIERVRDAGGRYYVGVMEKF